MKVNIYIGFVQLSIYLSMCSRSWNNKSHSWQIFMMFKWIWSRSLNINDTIHLMRRYFCCFLALVRSTKDKMKKEKIWNFLIWEVLLRYHNWILTIKFLIKSHWKKDQVKFLLSTKLERVVLGLIIIIRFWLKNWQTSLFTRRMFSSLVKLSKTSLLSSSSPISWKE